MKKLLIAPILLVIAIAVSAATIEVPEAPAFMLIAGGGVDEEVGGGGTTLTLVDTASSDSAYAISLENDMPTGTVENDIMFALVLRSIVEDIDTAPADWTLIGSTNHVTDFRCDLYYKLAGASESGPYTWTYTNNSRMSISIATYRGGFNASDIIDQHSNTSYTTSNTTVRAAGITVSDNDSPMIVVGGYYLNNTATTATAPASPGTFDEDLDYYNSNGDLGRFFYSQTISSGATGDMDVTISNTVANNKHAFAVSLTPDP